MSRSNELVPLVVEPNPAGGSDLPQPIWVQPLGWNNEQLREFLSQELDFSDRRSQVLERGIRKFSKDHNLSFYACSVYALDLLLRKQFDILDVEKHLLETLDAVEVLNPHHKEEFQAYKNILLTGRTGEGKSSLTNQIVGEDVAPIGKECKSETIGINLYVSERHGFSIIDSEGLDGTHATKTNQQLMSDIIEQTVYYLETDASIDAIIIMWCPIKNGHSTLAKTMKILKETLGDSITESCIFMIQGNWRKFAKKFDADLLDGVPATIKELKKEFPTVPIIEYDVKRPVAEQLPLLIPKIQEVKPYQVDVFAQKQKELFFQMVEAFKIKVGSLPEKKKKEFCKKFQSEMSEALKQKGTIVKQKKKWLNTAKKITLFAAQGLLFFGVGKVSIFANTQVMKSIAQATISVLAFAMNYFKRD